MLNLRFGTPAIFAEPGGMYPRAVKLIESIMMLATKYHGQFFFKQYPKKLLTSVPKLFDGETNAENLEL